MKPAYSVSDGWIIDLNNNRASIERWGSAEAAQASLATLRNCTGCADCTDSVHCTRCADLYDGSAFANVPRIDNIHAALLAAIEAPGNTLNMQDWHRCETTHCRAGWIVHLAGDAGYELERRTSTLFAAQQIYKASGHNISPCRFFDSNQKALDDIRRLAKEGE